MRIIISPAKKMNIDCDSLSHESLPQFLAEAKELLNLLRGMDYTQLKTLWHCNDAIARLNYERIQNADLQKNLTPAILSYDGIQYSYMAPSIFETEQLAYISEHLCILSGFYGLLRPFDGVIPYRLEMQAKLKSDGVKNLYHFWNDKLARQLCSESSLILNLASKEYSKAVSEHLPNDVRFLTCTFGEMQNGKVIEKGTACKMARGEMARWLAENRIEEPEHIKGFDRLGYVFSESHSTKDRLVFLKTKNERTEEAWEGTL